MTLTELTVTYTIVFIVSGIILFFLLSNFNKLRPYALFLATFITVCMIASLFYVRPTVLAPELSIIPPRQAEVVGYPLCIYEIPTNTSLPSDLCGWKGKNALIDMAFYFLIGIGVTGVYIVIRRAFIKRG